MILLLFFGKLAPGFMRVKSNLQYYNGTHGHMYSRSQDADTVQNIDLLVLGSSHAYRGYDPRHFGDKGIRMFNLGSSSQRPVQTNILLEKYIHRFNPKLVIFDIYPGVFSGDGVESAVDLIANGNLSPREHITMAVKINHIKVYNTALYSLLKSTFLPHDHFTESLKKGQDHYISGGYVESYKTFIDDTTSRMKSKYKVDNKQIEAFRNVIALLNKNKIPFLLIQSPVSSKFYNSKLNNHEMDNLFQHYGEYYNFNHKLSLPDSMFLDESHLNQSGVDVFNKFLLDTLSDKLQIYLNEKDAFNEKF